MNRVRTTQSHFVWQLTSLFGKARSSQRRMCAERYPSSESWRRRLLRYTPCGLTWSDATAQSIANTAVNWHDIGTNVRSPAVQGTRTLARMFVSGSCIGVEETAMVFFVLRCETRYSTHLADKIDKLARAGLAKRARIQKERLAQVVVQSSAGGAGMLTGGALATALCQISVSSSKTRMANTQSTRRMWLNTTPVNSNRNWQPLCERTWAEAGALDLHATSIRWGLDQHSLKK